MPTDLWFWIIATVAALFIGASKGGLPMVGVLAVPILSMKMSPVLAAGMTLPIYIVSDMYGLWMYRKEYSLRNIQIVAGAAVIGIIVGWATASITSENLVKFFVGLIGLYYCVDLFIKSRRKTPVEPQIADLPRGIFWGAITGFTSFVSHSGGAPFQMYVLPQRLEKMVYAGTSTITFAIINLVKLPPYWQLGQISVNSVETAAMLAPIALFGAWGGYHLTRILPETLFYRIVEIALFILSIKLIYDALVGGLF
jgi:uncharacterized protein